MNKRQLRIGDKVGLLRKGNMLSAHVTWKGEKTVKVRFYVSEQIITLGYDDIITVLEKQDCILANLLPELTSKHIFALENANHLLHKYKLTDWDFQFDDALRRGGQCGHVRKTISITWGFVSKASHSEIVDTLLHEIAHALVGAQHQHDAVWYNKAIEIGCSGRRTHDVTFSEPRWIKYCPQGHWVSTTNTRKLKRRRYCNQCQEYTAYERYSRERYEQIEESVKKGFCPE